MRNLPIEDRQSRPISRRRNVGETPRLPLATSTAQINTFMAQDIFELLHKHGLSRSHRHFSEHWCDRAPNYVALGNGLSEAATLAVARKLWRRRKWLLFLRVLYAVLWEVEEV